MYDFASDQQIPHIQKAIQFGRKAISIREQFLSEYRDETKDQTTDCSFKETDVQRRDNEKEKGDDFTFSAFFRWKIVLSQAEDFVPLFTSVHPFHFNAHEKRENCY